MNKYDQKEKHEKGVEINEKTNQNIIHMSTLSTQNEKINKRKVEDKTNTKIYLLSSLTVPASLIKSFLWIDPAFFVSNLPLKQ